MSLDSFFDYLEVEKNYSPNTVQAYRNDLNVFNKYLVDEHSLSPLTDANYSHIRSWIVSLVNNGLSNRSVNRKITSLNSYFKFLLKIDFINENPLVNHKALKTQKKIQLPFSESEMFAALSSDNFENSFTGVRDRFIIDLFYTTGIRRIELIQIKSKNYLSFFLTKQKIHSQNTNAVVVIRIAKLANVSGALSKVVINESW